MSTLLPQQIPPQDEKLLDETGHVRFNWYLFLYNLANKTLGDQPDPNSLLILLSEAISSDDVEPIPQAQLVPEIDAPFPVLLDPAALWLPDVPSANQASAESVVTVGASPFVYTASFAGNVLVTGGTVSVIEIARAGAFYTVGQTQGFVPVARLDRVRVTYSGLPTILFFPSAS